MYPLSADCGTPRVSAVYICHVASVCLRIFGRLGACVNAGVESIHSYVFIRCWEKQRGAVSTSRTCSAVRSRKRERAWRACWGKIYSLLTPTGKGGAKSLKFIRITVEQRLALLCIPTCFFMRWRKVHWQYYIGCFQFERSDRANLLHEYKRSKTREYIISLNSASRETPTFLVYANLMSLRDCEFSLLSQDVKLTRHVCRWLSRYYDVQNIKLHMTFVIIISTITVCRPRRTATAISRFFLFNRNRGALTSRRCVYGWNALAADLRRRWGRRSRIRRFHASAARKMHKQALRVSRTRAPDATRVSD